MIEIKITDIAGLEPAMRGMRNPLNSWAKSDSGVDHTVFYTGLEYDGDYGYRLGEADKNLARGLANGGPVHAKYRRMIMVWADITAPLYWWKEFDTYRMGVEKNSCSTMHTITQKEFEMDDFSMEHLGVVTGTTNSGIVTMDSTCGEALERLIDDLNYARKKYLETTDPTFKKVWWWQIIQLLPSSYNQKRTVMMSYEAIAHMYRDRRNHKLDEWREFCQCIEGLPYFAEMIDYGEDA